MYLENGSLTLGSLPIKDTLKEKNEKCTWGNEGTGREKKKKEKKKILVGFEIILYLALTLPQRKKLQPTSTLWAFHRCSSF